MKYTSGFPNDYTVKIHYFNGWFKTTDTFLAGEKSNIKDNAKDITMLCIFISIVLFLFSIALYSYIYIYTISEYNVLNNNKNDKKILRKSIIITIIIFFISLLFLVVFFTKFKYNLNKNTVSDNTDIMESKDNDNYANTENYEQNKEVANWMFKDNSGISIHTHGAWSGKEILTFEKTIDGGQTYIIQNPNGYDAHYGWKALFISSDIGFINDPGVPGDENNYGFYITTDGGKTFNKSKIICPNGMQEDDLYVDGVPYYEEGILKLKIYTVNATINQEKVYYEFYSDDNGQNWKYISK
ncbi:MAG TPA: hypothetical protein OIM45_03480 [Clostridiaceae bacterium]|nr:hypothetical protein [Clostridiaceae bacterium]